MGILNVFKHWIIPHKSIEVHLDPAGEGIRTGKDKNLIPWEKIKELRKDIRPFPIVQWPKPNLSIVTNRGEEIHTKFLLDLLEKEIREKAILNRKRVSFWTAQVIYFKETK